MTLGVDITIELQNLVVILQFEVRELDEISCFDVFNGKGRVIDGVRSRGVYNRFGQVGFERDGNGGIINKLLDVLPLHAGLVDARVLGTCRLVDIIDFQIHDLYITIETH